MKKIVIPLICFVVFFGFGCANKEEQAGKTADIKSEINLGGGYKNLKWGMSKDTVIKMMNQKVAEDLGDQIVFNLGRDQYTAAGETKSLHCFFYKDKLWKVEVTVPTCSAKQVHEELLEIPHSYIEFSPKHTLFNFYCASQADSKKVKEIVNQYGAKYFVAESKIL